MREPLRRALATAMVLLAVTAVVATSPPRKHLNATAGAALRLPAGQDTAVATLVLELSADGVDGLPADQPPWSASVGAQVVAVPEAGLAGPVRVALTAAPAGSVVPPARQDGDAALALPGHPQPCEPGRTCTRRYRVELARVETPDADLLVELTADGSTFYGEVPPGEAELAARFEGPGASARPGAAYGATYRSWLHAPPLGQEPVRVDLVRDEIAVAPGRAVLRVPVRAGARDDVGAVVLRRLDGAAPDLRIEPGHTATFEPFAGCPPSGSCVVPHLLTGTDAQQHAVQLELNGGGTVRTDR